MLLEVRLLKLRLQIHMLFGKYGFSIQEFVSRFFGFIPSKKTFASKSERVIGGHFLLSSLGSETFFSPWPIEDLAHSAIDMQRQWKTNTPVLRLLGGPLSHHPTPP